MLKLTSSFFIKVVWWHLYLIKVMLTLFFIKVVCWTLYFIKVMLTFISFVRFPPNFVEFKIMMCELCSIKDFIVHWVLPLLCLFGLRNFETIQYVLCDRKFSYMINQKFLKLCTLQDPNMKMCTLVVFPGSSSFPRIMSLKVVFQICFGSIKMMGMHRKKIIFIQTNSFIIFTYPNPVLLALGFWQVG